MEGLPNHVPHTSASWGHGHLDQNLERHLRSMNRSRNSAPHPARRHMNGIAGSANPATNSEHYNHLPRCRRNSSARICRLYTRNSPQHFPNQQGTSCQVNRNGLTSLLGAHSSLSPTYLYEAGNAFAVQQQPQTPPTNFANAAMYSHLINSNPNTADSHNGSQPYRPLFHHSPTNLNPSICMCCFHQLRFAASPQVSDLNK